MQLFPVFPPPDCYIFSEYRSIMRFCHYIQNKLFKINNQDAQALTTNSNAVTTLIPTFLLDILQ
jgi:hypothetical protein